MQTDDRICPKTGRRIPARRRRFWLVVATGVGSMLWFLLRVLPKPSRATYPCQRVAATTAVGFLAWLVGAAGLGALCRKVSHRLSGATVITALASGAALVGTAAWMLFAQPAGVVMAAYTTWTPTEGANAPMGQARGIFPGRVVWAYDPLATL